MYLPLDQNEIFGLIKPSNDVHTLGLSTISNLIKGCGYGVVMATGEEMEALREVRKLNNFSLLQKWIKDNKITRIGFSYRLDPNDALEFFSSFVSQLKAHNMFQNQGGEIKGIFFAGLPDSCQLINNKFNDSIICFPGDETPFESLTKLRISKDLFPDDALYENEYDKMRQEFATKYIEGESYKKLLPPFHSGYASFGTDKDTLIKRLNFCLATNTLPLTRLHAGPYNSDRLEAIKQFLEWVKTLASNGYLDILSIGTSQLSQSNFGENWEGLSNGGGVPVNSEIEFNLIKEAARPMLVRTYAGTKNLIELADIYERSLNISWHALSFWWFCQIDGRGKNSLQENLKEHFDTIRHIASTGKPFEPNVPHHFAFRGADDCSYIISGFLCVKAAKLLGINDLVLQIMLNTPKQTWGIQDVAKARTLLRLVRSLEDSNFRIHLQTRAGLDYFSPDLEKAKVQLAAVTAMMDDIEPENPNSPEIIHVVSYSEALRLATPDIMDDSIKITLGALRDYRNKKTKKEININDFERDINYRVEDLYDECFTAIRFLEEKIPDLYSPEGFYKLFKDGYFPLPLLSDENHEFSKAVSQTTILNNGGIKVIDNQGKIIRTIDRYKKIWDNIYFH